MRVRSVLGIAVLGILSLLSSTSWAALIQRVVLMDAGTVAGLTTEGCGTFVTTQCDFDSVTLRKGDVFELTIAFEDGQRLRARDNGGDQMFGVALTNSQGPEYIASQYSALWHFEVEAGRILINDFTHFYQGDLGPFTSNQTRGARLTDSQFSFNTLVLTFNILNVYRRLPDGSAVSEESVTYDRAFYYNGGWEFNINRVPEPASISLVLLAGLVAAALSRRGRRRH